MSAEIIISLVDDIVSDFLYYNRKECEDLPVGRIEELIKQGEISIDDIVEEFSSSLKMRIEK